MKASEVLTKYAEGERNFRRVSLRGQSFKGQELSGADFSEADLRSTNFTEANLRGTKFVGAEFGLQKRWIIFLTILLWLIAFISGLFLISAGGIVSLIFKSGLEEQIGGWVGLLVTVVCLILINRQGTGVGIVAVAGIGIVAIALAVATAGLVESAVGIGTGAAGVGVAVAIAGLVLIAIVIEVGEVVAGLVGSTMGVVVAVIVTVITAIVGFEGTIRALIALVVAVLLILLGKHIAWRSLRGDFRDAWLRSLAVAFAAIKGTSFQGADLTDANFSGSKLKSIDLRKATLTRVRWYGAKMLDRVRPGTTYLQTSQVRQWLIGKGVDKNFDGQKLQGVNFQGADLSDASFIDTNLSEADLQDADLSRAKLVQTQLDRTDFTGAILTGAFIEDWGITTHTKLDGVRCEYIYMRLPTDDDPEPCRKPDNREEVFEDGDFGDFIKPIFDTLDLYHNQGVDPRAIAISWKELTEKNSDARLQFASMEVKGQDNLLLRLKADPKADLSQLNAEYFETYNQIKALAEADSQKLLEEKDNRIQQLENMVNTALNRPALYAETYNHQGDLEMAGEKRDIEINNGNYNENIKGNYYEQSGNFGIGHMSGGEIKDGAKVAGIINEAENQNLASAAQEIQQLLEQLAATNPTTTSREKMIVVGEAVDRIENNPTLKSKVINALKSGGTEAFKEAVNHPLVNILVATIEGWQDADS